MRNLIVVISLLSSVFAFAQEIGRYDYETTYSTEIKCSGCERTFDSAPEAKGDDVRTQGTFTFEVNAKGNVFRLGFFVAPVEVKNVSVELEGGVVKEIEELAGYVSTGTSGLADFIYLKTDNVITVKKVTVVAVTPGNASYDFSAYNVIPAAPAFDSGL